MSEKTEYHVHVVSGAATNGQIVIVEGDSFEADHRGVLGITLDGKTQAVFAAGFWAAIVPVPSAPNA